MMDEKMGNSVLVYWVGAWLGVDGCGSLIQQEGFKE